MRFSIIIGLPFALSFAGSAALSSPVQWATNGHYYEVVTEPMLFGPDAETAAESSSFMGMSGYLATITSEDERDFALSLLNATSAFAAIIGLSDREVEGVFKYIGGPEDGLIATYLPWGPFEPSDFGGGEDYVEMFAGTGLFNDIHPPGTVYDARRAYVVEYSATAVVPLPAAGWLLLAGLSGLLVAGRNRNSA